MNCSTFLCLVALAWVGFQAAVFVGGLADGASEAPPVKLAPFDGESLPLNNAGAPYISQYQPSSQATVTLDRTGGVTGGCVKFELTEGCFYPQINAHNADGTRGFAREYVAGAWRWNTYNRLSFWIQVPTNNRPMDLTGRETMQVGTFVKRIREQDAHSDEIEVEIRSMGLSHTALESVRSETSHPRPDVGTNGRFVEWRSVIPARDW